jgi:ADP-heptose:LPS heptosyltransferase
MSSLSTKFAWHGNRLLLRNLWLLNGVAGRLTVVDQFSTPGDTVMCGTICRTLKARFPRLRLNVITRNPDLLECDPAIDELNGAKGFCHLAFEYLGILDGRANEGNVLASTLGQVGIRDYEYKARIHLRPAEIEAARHRLGPVDLPVVSINVMSKELVKVWRMDSWQELVRRLQETFTLIQIGDDKEPAFPGVRSFGGTLTKRESMAMIALAKVHIGPDSFLMHAANGLDVPSVIIYGGSRPAACLGYPGNRNLYVQLECSPCWLHTTKNEHCPHEMKCMALIGVDEVHQAVMEQFRGQGPAVETSTPPRSHEREATGRQTDTRGARS